jgi:rod shape-determining protein MreB
LNLFKLFKQELAVDLGTANTLIMSDGQVIVDEPSIVAIDRRTGETIAVGLKAWLKSHANARKNP